FVASVAGAGAEVDGGVIADPGALAGAGVATGAGAGVAGGIAAGAAAGAATVAGADTFAGIASVFPPYRLPSSGTIISATILMILISGFTAGPAVSLYGSPTVSPVTAALCASDPLPPWWPSSMYFFALSHAP